MAKILILDDDEKRHFSYKLKYRSHELVHAYSYSEAIKALDNGDIDVVHLDHDLGDLREGEGYMGMYGTKYEYTGADVAKHIVAMPGAKRPKQAILHSWNETGVKNMRSILKGQLDRVDVERFKS